MFSIASEVRSCDLVQVKGDINVMLQSRIWRSRGKDSINPLQQLLMQREDIRQTICKFERAKFGGKSQWRATLENKANPAGEITEVWPLDSHERGHSGLIVSKKQIE